MEQTKNNITELFPYTFPILKESELIKQDQLNNQGENVVPISKSLQSPNFKSDAIGWNLKSNGTIEINGNKVVSTNFTPVFSAKGLTFYISNGTTPNGNLSGNAGDVCFGADSGKAYKCTSSNTWLSFT